MGLEVEPGLGSGVAGEAVSEPAVGLGSPPWGAESVLHPLAVVRAMTKQAELAINFGCGSTCSL